MSKKMFLWLFPTLALLSLLSACRQGEAAGRLLLAFARPGEASRGFYPAGMAVASVAVNGCGPSGAIISCESSLSSPVELELAPGTWDFLAIGKSASGQSLLGGSLQLQLGAGETVQGSIVLLPLAGSGSLLLSWTCEGSIPGILQVEGSLSGPTGNSLAIGGDFDAIPLRFPELEAGAWTLVLELKADGQKICGLAESIFVAAGLETNACAVFSPTAARLALAFLTPDLGNAGGKLEPGLRRMAAGHSAAFLSPLAPPESWYCDAALLADKGNLAVLALPDEARKLRVDSLAVDTWGVPHSATASVLIETGRSLAGFSWASTILRDDAESGSPEYARFLGDCRDLAYSPDGLCLGAAGKSANCVGFLSGSQPGELFVAGSLGGAGEARLVAPSSLRSLGQDLFLAAGESENSLYFLRKIAGTWILDSLVTGSDLTGPKDLAVSADLNQVYVASSGADCISLIPLAPDRRPQARTVVAAKGPGDLAALSRPSCLALSPDGGLLAVGTTGDDALYLFDRSPIDGNLVFRQRIEKTAFPAATALSDPCSLAFSADGLSLFVLSYYGKSILRLDRGDPGSAFAFVAGAKSGVAGISGFATPRRMALDPGSKILAVIGSGAEDGLALFDASLPSVLSWLGCLLPGSDHSVPSKPLALAFSPDGKTLALAADSCLAFFTKE